MEIIPAIYILDGRCVALYKGSFEQKASYEKSPINIAKFFEKAGAKKLFVVDLDSRAATATNQQNNKPTGVIQKILAAVKIPVQLEASFQTLEAIKAAFFIFGPP